MTAQEWLEELELLSEAATPGPWESGKVLARGTVVHGHNMIIDCRHTPDEGGFGKHNAVFIAAANPQTVQRLVEMLRLAVSIIEAQKAQRVSEGEMDIKCDTMQHLFDMTEPTE